MRPTAILGIGIPASGKTFDLKPLSDKIESFYLSSDAVRQELTGDEADQSQNVPVWDLLYRRLGELLSQGFDVVVDATNAQFEDRRRMVKFCHQYNALVIGRWYDTDLEICLGRNRFLRDRHVLENKIIWMHQCLSKTPPTLTHDGFDLLFRINRK